MPVDCCELADCGVTADLAENFESADEAPPAPEAADEPVRFDTFETGLLPLTTKDDVTKRDKFEFGPALLDGEILLPTKLEPALLLPKLLDALIMLCARFEFLALLFQPESKFD